MSAGIGIGETEGEKGCMHIYIFISTCPVSVKLIVILSPSARARQDRKASFCWCSLPYTDDLINCTLVTLGRPLCCIYLVEVQFRSVLLYGHRDHKDYQEQGAQDGHLDFYTASES